MNHLGGMVTAWWFLVEWFTRPMFMVFLVYLTCGWPPRNKEIWYVKCWEASSAATWQYGLCLDHIGCNNLAIWTVGGSGMIGWSASICSKGRLLKGPVLVKIKSCGESAQPLQMEESKYLAMSLVLDNLSIKTWKLSRISSSQFSKLKLVVEQGWRFTNFYWWFLGKDFIEEKLSDFN